MHIKHFVYDFMGIKQNIPLLLYPCPPQALSWSWTFSPLGSGSQTTITQAINNGDYTVSDSNTNPYLGACGIILTINCITTLLSPITALCVAGVTETDNAPGINAYIYIYIYIVIGLNIVR
jgi:hypothetical protein